MIKKRVKADKGTIDQCVIFSILVLDPIEFIIDIRGEVF